MSINIGCPAVVVSGGRRYSTAINRTPLSDPVELTESGFAGDRVADSQNHGGPDKAVCCFPQEHLGFFSGQLQRDLAAGAFGENLTLQGLLETEACIGDVYAAGEVRVQVSQPRQPCWKLAARHESPQLVRWVQESGYTGFYVRVLRSGVLTTGDRLSLEDRPHPDLTVRDVHFFRGAGQQDEQTMSRLADLPELSESWRKHFQDQLKSI